MIRYLLMGLGWLFFAIGLIGVFLPILPTTPFMLLAAACFSKSSERFHRWLLNNRVFGPVIKDWQEHGIIQPHAKRRALLLVALTFLISILIVPKLWLKFMLVGFWLASSFFIARLPTSIKIQK